VNTFQLIFKNMRQRALSTWLTMLSVALGVALAIAVILFYREGDRLFVQSDFGYNVLLGPKGDEMGLVFNSVYGLGTSKGSIPWSVHEELLTTKQASVRWAMPFMVGDSWQGKRVMATSSRLVTSQELETFRTALLGLGTDLRTIGRPSPTESAADRDARIQKVPGAIEAAMKQVAQIDDTILAPLDLELVDRFKGLRATLKRAHGRIDANNPAMTDAAGRIAADAVDQLRLLAGFAAPFEYRAGLTLQLEEGRTYDARKFEGVAGATAAAQLRMKLGDTFQLEHGNKAGDIHEEKWTVVGILEPTGTALDDTLFIPIYSGWAIPEHEEGLESIARFTNPNADLQPAIEPPTKPADDGHVDHDQAGQGQANEMMADHHDDHDHAGHDHAHEGAYEIENGRIHLHLDEEKWRVSGIFVGTRDQGRDTMLLRYQYMNTPMAMAVPVASTMSEFFKNFLTGPTYVLLALAVLVTVVAAVSILVSIYNAVSARRREIAILRALGATKEKVLALIVLEAALVGLLGAVVGVVLGHVLAGVGSTYLQNRFGHGVNVLSVDWREIAYVVGVVVIAALAGLVPALRAYKTSVARNLVAE
jgi:putative ABC transport system permease protein